MRNILFLISLMTSLSAWSQITSYSINQQINGPGILYFDIDADSQDDFYFDVIELSPGIFAARVTNVGLSAYLDNSTFHYPDALNTGDTVEGYFNNGNGVLGTFTGAGLFSGAGDKYLGIRIYSGVDYYFGWIKLNCNGTNDTLKIISCGFNNTAGDTILAGQTFINAVTEVEESEEVFMYPNPTFDNIKVTLPEGSDHKNVTIDITDISGQLIETRFYSNDGELGINLENYPSGTYFIRINNGILTRCEKIVKQ